MSFQSFLGRIANAAKRRLCESPRRARQRRRAATRRTFLQSLFRWDAPLEFIVPWRRVMLLECLESRVLMFGGPVAQQDGYRVLHDQVLTMTAPGVLANDYDQNQLPLTAILETNPSHGTLSFHSDGSFVYTPATHFTGTDSFTYEDYDGQAYSSPATVTINVYDQAPQATQDQYQLQNDQTLTVSAANGVMANDGDPDGDPITAALASEPSHGSVTLNADGSFSYTPVAHWTGTDSFTYTASDGVESSGPATVTLRTMYGIVSAVDQTKIPVDTLHVSRQILSDPFSGGVAPVDGAPATAHNLSLVYDSVAGQPDVVIEADLGLSDSYAMNDTLTATLTFNGVQQAPQYFNMQSLNGSDSHVHLAQQIDVSSLATGRYAWSLSVTSQNVSNPTTISGYVNVVNNSSSPIGKGWDISGLYRIYPNNMPGVPAGVLLSTGDGRGWFFTQSSGNSYTSPNGPYAFDTLVSVAGGGWQLTDKYGTQFVFNSTGQLTKRVERTGETTAYNWSGGLLVSIEDQFSRVVDLGYTSGLLSSISDFANNVWTIGHTGSNLTNVTEPDPGGGSPVWGYSYTGNYLSSVSDPNSNVTSYTLDSYHRLSGVSLPGGASTSATSEQDFGYGSTSQSSPASLTTQSQVLPSATDALGAKTNYQTDTFGDPIYSQDAYGNVTQWVRDANGLATELIEPAPTPGAAAPVTNYTLDTLGNVTNASGAHPTYGTYVFNQFSEWTSFKDLQGNTWTRSFDTHGNLQSTQDPLLNTVTYTVDALGYPLSMTTPAPNNAAGTVTTNYTHDQYERLTTTTWADASTSLTGYDADDRTISATDENGHQTITNRDVLGRIVSIVNAMNGVVSYTLDKDGNILTTSDEMSDVTQNVWSARNELIKQILADPDGAGPLTSPVWQWTYDAAGDKLTQTDPMNRVTSWAWDKLGDMTQETLPDPDGAGPLASPVITIGYDNLRRKVSEQDPLGTTTWAYANTDTSQVTSMTLPDPDGSGPQTSPVWTYSYDTLGRRYKTIDPMNHAQTTSFDADGRTESVLDNLGHGPVYAYGHMGELLSTTDSMSDTTSDEYDNRFRLIETKAADGGITQIQLDPAGNRIGLIDPDNNHTVWGFDALNRETSEKNALNFTRTFSYDAASDLISETDRDNRTRNWEYDNLHRQTAENWLSGGTVVYAINTSYDADNEVTSQSDPDSSDAFTFDGDGNVLSVDNAGTPNVPHVVLTAGYDSANDRTSLAATVNGTADFLNNYTFDADQRLTDETQQGQSGGNGVAPKQITFGYNPLGQFTSIARYDFVGTGPMVDIATAAYSYDGANRMTGLAYTGNGGSIPIDSFTFTLDAADRITARDSTVDGEVDYGYDVTNQVTSANYTGAGQPANEAYSYTKNGNRTNAGYQTGTNNQLLSDGTFNYSYDGEGNRTVRTRISNAPASDYKTTYSWDYRNRLTDLEFFNNSGVLTKHVHYVYDTLDHEIGKQVDDTGGGTYDRAEWYVLDTTPPLPLGEGRGEGGVQANVPSTSLADPLLQFDQSGNLAYRYLNGPTPAGVDAVMAEEKVTTPGQAGSEYFALGDQVNTPHEIVDVNSVVADHIVTNSFGVVASESNTAIHHWMGFGGGHNDPDSGLVNNDHRWYDPATGRWASEDPDAFAAGDVNLSRVINNNPLIAIDPVGLFPQAQQSSTTFPSQFPTPWPVQTQVTPSATINGMPNWMANGGLTGSFALGSPMIQYINGGILYTWSNGAQYFQPIAYPVQPTFTFPTYQGPLPQLAYYTVPATIPHWYWYAWAGGGASRHHVHWHPFGLIGVSYGGHAILGTPIGGE